MTDPEQSLVAKVWKMKSLAVQYVVTECVALIEVQSSITKSACMLSVELQPVGEEVSGSNMSTVATSHSMSLSQKAEKGPTKATEENSCPPQPWPKYDALCAEPLMHSKSDEIWKPEVPKV